MGLNKSDIVFLGINAADMAVIASQCPEDVGGQMIAYDLNDIGVTFSPVWYRPDDAVIDQHLEGTATFWVSQPVFVGRQYYFSRLRAVNENDPNVSQAFVIPSLPGGTPTTMRAGVDGRDALSTKDTRWFLAQGAGPMYKFRHQAGNHNGLVRNRLDAYNQANGQHMIIADDIIGGGVAGEANVTTKGYAFVGYMTTNLTIGNTINNDNHYFEPGAPSYDTDHLADYINNNTRQVLGFDDANADAWRKETTVIDYTQNIVSIATVAGVHNFGSGTRKLAIQLDGVGDNKVWLTQPQRYIQSQNFNPRSTKPIQVPNVVGNAVVNSFLLYRMANFNNKIGYYLETTVVDDSSISVRLMASVDGAADIALTNSVTIDSTWAVNDWIYPQIEVIQLGKQAVVRGRISVNANGFDVGQADPSSELEALVDLDSYEENVPYFSAVQVLGSAAETWHFDDFAMEAI